MLIGSALAGGLGMGMMAEQARQPLDFGPLESPLVRVTAPGAVRLRTEAEGVVIRTNILAADQARAAGVPAVVIWVERESGVSTRVAIGADGLGTLMRVTDDTGEEVE